MLDTLDYFSVRLTLKRLKRWFSYFSMEITTMKETMDIKCFAEQTGLGGYSIVSGEIAYDGLIAFIFLDTPDTTDMLYLPFPIHSAKGDFMLCDMHNLTDLRNTPRVIGDRFDFQGCDKIASWEGSRVERCGTLNIMGSGLHTFSGGPSTVDTEILVYPEGFDFYDLPGGTWTSLIFETDTFTKHTQDEVRSALSTLTALPKEAMPLVLASPASTPITRWIASRLLEGLEPFHNFR